jgi:hypothetical protein
VKLGTRTLGLALALAASNAFAADAGAPTALPPGHPVVAGSTSATVLSTQPLPAGHPSVADDGDDDDSASMHGHGGMGATPGDADGAQEDDALPVGTIEATILDGANRPIPKATVTLGILQTSVAKGENRRRVFKETDERGVVRFGELEPGSGYAYRVSVSRDMATFAVLPFQLSMQKGSKVKLHVYPVTSDLQQTQIGAQAVVYVELKDDRIQVQQLLTVINLGRTAWVPQNVVMKLPPGFTALSGTQQMSDIGIDPIEKTGARLRGTFGPGRHMVELRWQYPYSGEREVDLDVELMPRVVVARVLAPASQQMKLVVDGFPASEPMIDPQGQRILQTERALRTRDDPEMKRLHISLRDLPTPGPARLIVTGISGAVALGAIAWGVHVRRSGGERKGGNRKEERARILEELAELERARKTGDVGPKTYERARRELIDALARTFVKADKAA